MLKNFFTEMSDQLVEEQDIIMVLLCVAQSEAVFFQNAAIYERASNYTNI